MITKFRQTRGFTEFTPGPDKAHLGSDEHYSLPRVSDNAEPYCDVVTTFFTITVHVSSKGVHLMTMR